MEVFWGEDSPQKLPLLNAKQRVKGLGTGRIQSRTIVKPNGKKYQQAWYDYEVWDKGDCLVKKTKYIPKRLVAKIQELESIKAGSFAGRSSVRKYFHPVAEILKLLGVD